MVEMVYDVLTNYWDCGRIVVGYADLHLVYASILVCIENMPWSQDNNS